MARIEALCVSETKGVQKQPVDSVVFVAGRGIEGDAHAGAWHRQVSLLADGDIQTIRDKGLPDLAPGAFAENVVLSGLDLSLVTKALQCCLGCNRHGCRLFERHILRLER